MTDTNGVGRHGRHGCGAPGPHPGTGDTNASAFPGILTVATSAPTITSSAAILAIRLPLIVPSPLKIEN
jgi:hypothetical protein